ncbi:MAG TPA: PfkB family carbohydrate kinase [Acetomicrobium flavidum]|uniref:bifunctional heptose 7-phosphate kinase/heptose 1-phosphate adenyltransferase n=2 Tax=Acetomicrobium flavidum TaxID=49896 RepID=UPI002C4ED64B|nr:PfkB family carbohydrate kinase [Acetomicrobium flavidum]HPU68668.1 PfkB family carbohydrate kinase [Acetomicrobium flavidum]
MVKAKRCKVAIIGDVMIDHYIIGRASRLSPEAPVPVVEVVEEEYRPGGAANVAANVAALGHDALLITPKGADAYWSMLESLLGRFNVNMCTPLALDIPTIRKTRILARSQQIVRVDWDSYVDDRYCDISSKLLSVLPSLDADVLVLSDYAKGIVSETIAKTCIKWAIGRGIPIIVDPKPQHKDRYIGATAMTPNKTEAELLLGRKFDERFTPGDGARMLRETLAMEAVIVTLGDEGMVLASRDETIYFSARAREVYDVSGAGDTVVASVAVARGLGLPWRVACEFATLTAGLVVQKMGTAVVTPEEVEATPEWQRLKAYFAADVDLADKPKLT